MAKFVNPDLLDANPSMIELKRESLRLLNSASGAASSNRHEDARNLIAAADVVAKLALVAGIQEDLVDPDVAGGMTTAVS